jgi:hypothetical protein
MQKAWLIEYKMFYPFALIQIAYKIYKYIWRKINKYNGNKKYMLSWCRL